MKKVYILYFIFISISFAIEKISLPVVFTDVAPLIDGKLNDVCWDKSSHIPHLFITLPQKRYGEIPENRTQVFLLYDKENLYLGFICDDSNTESLVMPNTSFHDAPWGADCIEIFLKPSVEDKSFFQIVVYPNGSLLDIYYHSPGNGTEEWDSGAAVCTYIEKNRWSVEIAIPLAELKLSPKVTERWQANFVRWIPRHSVNQSWTLLKGSNHQPEEFNWITGISLDYSVYSISDKEINWGDMCYGRNFFTAKLKCEGKKSPCYEAKLTVFQEGVQTFEMTRRLAFDTEIIISMFYNISKQGETRIDFKVYDKEKNVPIFSKSKYFIVSDIFTLLWPQTVYYLSEKYMILKLKINIAEGSLQKHYFEFIFLDSPGKSIKRIIKSVSKREMKVYLPIEFLCEGKNAVIINLCEDRKKKKIDSKKIEILRIKGFIN